MDILLCRPSGPDHGVDEVVAGLSSEHRITVMADPKMKHLPKALDQHDALWLEGAGRIAEALTRQQWQRLQNKRVICRLRGREALAEAADQVNYQVIDDLVFSSPMLKRAMLDRRPELARQAKRLHVIPPGIGPLAISPAAGRDGFKIAYVFPDDHPEDPTAALLAFKAIHDHDHRYTLHLAGPFSAPEPRLSLDRFVGSNRLERYVFSDGPVGDLSGWMAAMGHVLCVSLWAGLPRELLAAMASGCRPLIFNGPGAEGLVPSRLTWSNLEELIHLLERETLAEESRGFVESNLSLSRFSRAMLEMLSGAAVEYPDPDSRQAPPPREGSGAAVNRPPEAGHGRDIEDMYAQEEKVVAFLREFVGRPEVAPAGTMEGVNIFDGMIAWLINELADEVHKETRR